MLTVLTTTSTALKKWLLTSKIKTINQKTDKKI